MDPNELSVIIRKRTRPCPSCGRGEVTLAERRWFRDSRVTVR